MTGDDSEEVGTGAGEGATGQDTGTAWVTRSADCPEAPAQAHPLGPDGFTRLAGDAAYDRLHGVDGHIQSVTPGRIPPAYHEHDAAGCLDCDCNAAPWSSKTPCTCPVEDAATLAALDRLRRERDEHQWNALKMARKAERRAEDAEAEAERLRDALVAVRRAFDLQCPPGPAENYVDRGAWMAHSWWDKVLGNILNRAGAGDIQGEGAGCDCIELCSMGPTCPGGMLARLPGSGCWRMACPDGRQHSWMQWPDGATRCRHCGEVHDA